MNNPSPCSVNSLFSSTNSYADCAPSLISALTSATAAMVPRGCPFEIQPSTDIIWKDNLLEFPLICSLPSPLGLRASPNKAEAKTKQKQRHREETPSFSLPTVFIEAEEKPKGKKQRRHKVLSSEQPNYGKTQASLPQEKLWAELHLAELAKGFFIAEDFRAFFNNLCEILAYSICSD